MSFITPLRIPFFVLVVIIYATGTVSAASTGIDWKQLPLVPDTAFSGVTLAENDATVFSGGSQILVRTWDDRIHWGGAAGFIAAMSTDGRYVITGSGDVVTMFNSTGKEIWARTMIGQVQAVAVSHDGSLVITADDKGYLDSWAPNGDLYVRNKTGDMVKTLAIAPAADLIVATTSSGLRYYTPSLTPCWTDNRSGSLDEYILISDDGGTIISAGGPRLSSHSRTGILNWQADVTKATITDIACNEDCSIIITGSQDNTVRGIDRYGKVHWEFDTKQWPNAVASSETGNVIAAGANDGTLYILDHSGSLLTKRTFDGRIQPRTLEVSRDGTRIVTADQKALYGLYLLGMNGDTSDTTFVAAPITPAARTTTLLPATTLPDITVPPEETPISETSMPSPTHQSPSGTGAILASLAGGIYAFLRGKN